MSNNEKKALNENSQLRHQIKCLKESILEMANKKQKAMDMVWQKTEAIKTRDIAIDARDKYIKELEARLEYYEGKECAGPLSGKH